jgi:hypothetical protein
MPSNQKSKIHWSYKLSYYILKDIPWLGLITSGQSPWQLSGAVKMLRIIHW